jgi:hypothetical protein
MPDAPDHRREVQTTLALGHMCDSVSRFGLGLYLLFRWWVGAADG